MTFIRKMKQWRQEKGELKQNLDLQGKQRQEERKEQELLRQQYKAEQDRQR